MKARQEFALIPQVQLKQKFWVTEDSKAKLMMVGAKYLDTVTHIDHYYDTASDELAMAGLWLSQRNQQWSLIVESQKEETQENTAYSVPDTWETSCQNLTKNVQHDTAIVYKDPAQLEYLNNDQQPDLKTADREGECTKSSSTYTELVGESEIITYLLAHLHIDLKTNERENMTMEDFLQKAGIQHYASNHIINQTTYLLSNKYTILIQREESSLKESATVLLDVDIFNICKGLEDIETLATYLGFELQGIQSEQECIM
ncbi:uncharacterized protein LOC112540077 [Python bivittatus]|uniref:Uncharacterized protein LOC112540077 n=1 Tax=Python bivittatus TaxID=176946 RepID=A0A9F5IU82_PYTBI|nr:uncharacterized protein LOC112540077 [Python bivittatus]